MPHPDPAVEAVTRHAIDLIRTGTVITREPDGMWGWTTIIPFGGGGVLADPVSAKSVRLVTIAHGREPLVGWAEQAARSAQLRARHRAGRRFAARTAAAAAVVSGAAFLGSIAGMLVAAAGGASVRPAGAALATSLAAAVLSVAAYFVAGAE